MASVSKQEDFQGMYKVKKRFRLACKQVPAFFPRLFWLFAAICQKKVCCIRELFLEFECVYDVEMSDVTRIREILIRSSEKETENLIHILTNVLRTHRKHIIELTVSSVV